MKINCTFSNLSYRWAAAVGIGEGDGSIYLKLFLSFNHAQSLVPRTKNMVEPPNPEVCR